MRFFWLDRCDRYTALKDCASNADWKLPYVINGTNGGVWEGESHPLAYTIECIAF